MTAKIYELGEKGENKMEEVTIFDVAKHFLNRVDIGAGSVMTHLKLQKMCYYAQAWHLVFAGKPMFIQEFQAWDHGPVCPELWQAYRGYRWQPIPRPEQFDTVFGAEQNDTLEEVWDTYGRFDAKYLERLTHKEEPWIKARGNCLSGEYCDNVISHQSMKDYYRNYLNDGEN